MVTFYMCGNTNLPQNVSNDRFIAVGAVSIFRKFLYKWREDPVYQIDKAFVIKGFEQKICIAKRYNFFFNKNVFVRWNNYEKRLFSAALIYAFNNSYGIFSGHCRLTKNNIRFINAYFIFKNISLQRADFECEARKFKAFVESFSVIVIVITYQYFYFCLTYLVPPNFFVSFFEKILLI